MQEVTWTHPRDASIVTTTRGVQLSKTVTRTHGGCRNDRDQLRMCHGPGKAHVDAELLAEKNDTKDPEAKKLIFRFDGSAKVNSASLPCVSSNQQGT